MVTNVLSIFAGGGMGGGEGGGSRLFFLHVKMVKLHKVIASSF